MTRYMGGQNVKAGFYFNLESWKVTTLSGEGGVLPGGGDTRYLRVPLPLLLVLAPMMGAAFAIFLPFIGIAMVLDFAMKKAYAAGREALHATVVALSPRLRTGEAYFTGGADEKKTEAGESAAKTTDEVEARLDRIEKAIDEKERQS